VANKCPSVAGHFNDHGEALKQHMRHLPMQHVQGYTGSHWTPPSGNYSLHIALAATRATTNKMKMQNVSTLLTISMAIAVRRYYTARIARWWRFVAFIKATKRRHWASTCSNRHQSDMPTPILVSYFRGIFHSQIVEKELELP
jgi:hypothetical protein